MRATVRKLTSSDAQIGARATLHAGFDRIFAGLPLGDGWESCAFNGLRLGSHFQPIFDVAQQRCVAYEGLLQATNSASQRVNPESVFALSAGHQEELFLDWLCRALHLRNFRNLADADALLFLNAYPAAAIEDPHHPLVFREMIDFYGISPQQVVVEILETGTSDEAKLVDAARLYRKLGCRIAIDDFGIGYSNFDRLWRLHPDYVKIDRSVTASAVRETHARLVLANLVKLIHECGSKVIVEGIETRDEALTALEVGADFVQGYYFARPGLAAVPASLCAGMFGGLQEGGPLRGRIGVRSNSGSENLDVYVSALSLAILDLQRGASFAHATAEFRALTNVLRIYLATSEAVEPGESDKSGNAARLVLDMIETSLGQANGFTGAGNDSATARLRELLQGALDAPQRMQIAMPPAADTASESADQIITLSCAFELDSRPVVLCGDLRDRRAPPGMPPVAERTADRPSPASPASVTRLHL